ncbi:DUF4411 family protein [Georgenia sp. AZ-5]|uniref:DUF4411 family protein n=1 Tax=Georgenia sp. AZ-5 TaxID=3367526 RepID=UPI003754E311
MSRPPSDGSDGFPPGLVVVVDTSALIQLKRLVPIARQWPTLNLMSELVDGGHLCYPRQVRREMAAGKHPDAPGAWAVANDGQCRHPAPRDEAIAEVLAVAQLVDLEAEDDTEVADPYVAAMAWQIRETHPQSRVVVATNDFVDRMPVKEALATACNRLAIEYWRADEFVAWLDGEASQN